jgi:glucose/arabinose dehydrogenase
MRTLRQYVLLRPLTALVPVTALAAALLLTGGEACSQQQRNDRNRPGQLLVGQGALGDWTADAPGVRRRITTADMPSPYATRSVDAGSRVVKRPEGAWPQVPAGFKVEEFAAGLTNPRLIRTSPNGDLFVAESQAGRVRVLRGAAGKAETSEIFTAALRQPFGIAFYPPGPDPRYVYVSDTDAVLRRSLIHN